MVVKLIVETRCSSCTLSTRMCFTSQPNSFLASGQCSLASLFMSPSFISFTTWLWLLSQLCTTLCLISSIRRILTHIDQDGAKRIICFWWEVHNCIELGLSAGALGLLNSWSGMLMLSGMLLLYTCVASILLLCLARLKVMARTSGYGSLVILFMGLVWW